MPATKQPDQAANERPQKPRDTPPHARVEDHRVIESSLEAGPPKKAGLLRRTLAVLGPGLITGAAHDDPSGISTCLWRIATGGKSSMLVPLLRSARLVRAGLRLDVPDFKGVRAG
jgi:hypothetical protein